MSDAMNPSPSLPDDSAQPPAALPVSGVNRLESGEDDWETVNFPGTMNVDAIPTPPVNQESAVTGAANLFDPESYPAVPDPTPVMQQLQHENALLRSQLAQLEDDLSQAQIELQLEMARFYCKEADAEVMLQVQEPEALAQAEAQTQAFNEQIQALNEQIQALQQTLETTQQSLEQQQSLVEQKESTVQSLTNQLDNSQQRIAQLERDCALSQQRYDEQLQLVSQAENTCQDLRMRLHRQQQQTLQFKAALEKSIEMNAVATTHLVDTDAIAAAEAEMLHPDSEPAFIPKARPVQPWSTAPRLTPHVHAQAKSSGGLGNLLAKLAQQPQPDDSAAIEPSPVEEASSISPDNEIPERLPPTPAIDEASKNILEFLFPAQPAAPIENPAPAQAAVFDLSPFVEAGEIDADQLSTNHEVIPTEPVVHFPQPDPVPAIPAPMPGTQPAGLWADLARLIEPDLVDADLMPASNEAAGVDPNAIAPQADSLPQPAAPPQEISHFEGPISFVISDPIAQDAMVAEESSVIAHNPFPSFTLHAPNFPSDAAIVAIDEIPDLSDSAPGGNSPSPILYPTRQPKKIPSMAAVDLPSFPRG